MNLALLVYLASVVNSISALLGVFGITLIIANIAIVAAMAFSNYGIKEYSWETPELLEKQNKIKSTAFKYSKYSIPLFAVMLILSALIPSERTIYLMAAAYATEQIATNDRVQKIGSDVLEVIEDKLSEFKEPEQ